MKQAVWLDSPAGNGQTYAPKPEGPGRGATRLAALTFVLFLGGCADFDNLFKAQDKPSSADRQAATFDPALATPGPDNTFAARPRDKPTPPKPNEVASAPADPQPAQLPPLPDEIPSDSVVGMSEVEAGRLFGPPQFVIRKQPSVRWHYVTETCTLDLYFFEDLESRARRILAYDVSGASAGADPDALKTCAEAIRTERIRDAG